MDLVDCRGTHDLPCTCERLLTFTKQPSLRSVLTILKNGQDKLPLETLSKPSHPEKRSKGITRGAAAFAKGGDAE